MENIFDIFNCNIIYQNQVFAMIYFSTNYMNWAILIYMYYDPLFQWYVHFILITPNRTWIFIKIFKKSMVVVVVGG